MHLKSCLIFFFFLQLDEFSQLLLGQRTGNTAELGAGSEDCGTQFTAEHVKTEDSLSPLLLENSSVETPRRGQVVTLFQKEKENAKSRMQDYYYFLILVTSTPFRCPLLFSDSCSLSFGM